VTQRLDRRAAALLVVFGVAVPALAQGVGTQTRNIIFVMTDGLRWQEVFLGADGGLMNKEHGHVSDVEGLRRRYWRETSTARREALMPFVWATIAKKGQIFGNRELGSDAYVTNGHNFSYPGYSETLTGVADPRVDSNDKKPNPNVTVLEWLHRKPAYRGSVAAFGAWDTFPFIFNAARAGFPVNAGYDPLVLEPMTPRLELLNELKRESPRMWEGEPFDNLTFHTAFEYWKQRKPRLLYLSLGETDEWAHAGQYAEYLDAAHRADSYLRMLWEAAQAMPEYRGVTTLIFSPDHGRGNGRDDWKDHGEKVPESKYIWMAFLGPDTRALGERSRIAPVTQNRIAATLAAFLGEQLRKDVPAAGEPIGDVLPRF
jgi:hypothetical protein